jgi:hypothetical protein
MRLRTLPIIGIGTILLLALPLQAETRIVVERSGPESATAPFQFKKVPSPSQNDAATKARFTLLDGNSDSNGGALTKLHDGRLPTEEDQPAESFFFNAGTDGGPLLVDLGSVIDIKQVNTYSWHPGPRGPQVYTLYTAAGNAAGFDPQPKRGTDPQECGWKRIARIDTRPKEGGGGGQYGVSICDSLGTIGRYRYLLFEVSRTEGTDAFGNTFYCEIDVVDPTTPAVAAAPATETTGEVRREVVEAEGGTYQITSKNIARAKYDGNYRISGNFLNWVTETYCKDIVQRLNAAARQGKYSEELWKTTTGHTVQELGDEWKASLEKKIAAEKAEAAKVNETKK